MSDRIRCERCTMSFRVMQCPWQQGDGRWRGDVTRCAEPGCRRPYWHGKHYYVNDKIRVGIDPQWLAEWGVAVKA